MELRRNGPENGHRSPVIVLSRSRPFEPRLQPRKRSSNTHRALGRSQLAPPTDAPETKDDQEGSQVSELLPDVALLPSNKHCLVQFKGRCDNNAARHALVLRLNDTRHLSAHVQVDTTQSNSLRAVVFFFVNASLRTPSIRTNWHSSETVEHEAIAQIRTEVKGTRPLLIAVKNEAEFSSMDGGRPG